MFNSRIVLKTLVIRDFKNRYLSSYIGLPWAFIQPSMYVVVIWFAFSFGLRAGTTESGHPFVAWLLAGLIPWMYISQTMIMTCNAINEYAYLIKKTSFPVSLIPIIKILSGVVVHGILILMMVSLLFFGFNIRPTIYWLQIIYYLFSMMVLLTGIGLLVSSVNVFVKDMAHVINVMVTMLFWATPIIWPYSMLVGNYRYIALLNPFFYIIQGYRYTFIEQTWFFEYVELNIYFWTVTAFIFIVGTMTFYKLRPDFGDEL